METKHVMDIPEWMQDWNWSKNNEESIYPSDISASSRKKVFWKCHVCSGEWGMAPQYRKKVVVLIVQILKHFQDIMI